MGNFGVSVFNDDYWEDKAAEYGRLSAEELVKKDFKLQRKINKDLYAMAGSATAGTATFAITAGLSAFYYGPLGAYRGWKTIKHQRKRGLTKALISSRGLNPRVTNMTEELGDVFGGFAKGGAGVNPIPKH